MIETALLQPVIALVAWTFVMWVWMYATRIPAMQAARVDLDEVSRTGTKPVLPATVARVADNYNHLHEQPTLFYALAITGAVSGTSVGWVTAAAWLYVGFRVAHSLLQATVNKILVRLGLFCLASLALLAMLVGIGGQVFS